MGDLLTRLPSLSLGNCGRRSCQLQYVRATETSKFPHCPHGRLTFCSLFAGRRCLCRWWLSGHLFVHDQWEHSKRDVRRGAHSCSKCPIAPMGDSRFARCLQGGGVIVWGGTVSIVNSQIYSNTANSVRTHLQKFPSPPRETHVLLVVCREPVSMSLPAPACQRSQ